jgi:hypothetical protein
MKPETHGCIGRCCRNGLCCYHTSTCGLVKHSDRWRWGGGAQIKVTCYPGGANLRTKSWGNKAPLRVPNVNSWGFRPQVRHQPNHPPGGMSLRTASRSRHRCTPTTASAQRKHTSVTSVSSDGGDGGSDGGGGSDVVTKISSWGCRALPRMTGRPLLW